jgi:hypothetical protein
MGESDDTPVVGSDQRPAARQVRLLQRPPPGIDARGGIKSVQVILRDETAVTRLPRPHVNLGDRHCVIDMCGPDLHPADASSSAGGPDRLS